MELFEKHWKKYLNEAVKFSPELEEANQRLVQEIRDLIEESREVRIDIVDIIMEAPEDFFDITDEVDDPDFDYDIPLEEFFTNYVDGMDYVDDPDDFFNIYLPLLLDRNPESFAMVMNLVSQRFLEHNEEIKAQLVEAILEVYDLDLDKINDSPDDQEKASEIVKSVFESLGSALASAVT